MDKYDNQDRWGSLYSMPYNWIMDQKSSQLYMEIYSYLLVYKEWRKKDNNDPYTPNKDEALVKNWSTLCRLLRKTVSVQTKVKKAVLEMEEAGLITTRRFNNILFIKVNMKFKYKTEFNPSAILKETI